MAEKYTSETSTVGESLNTWMVPHRFLMCVFFLCLTKLSTRGACRPTMNGTITNKGSIYEDFKALGVSKPWPTL